MARRVTPLMDRLMKRVTVADSGCWLWSGPTNGRGYGTTSRGRASEGRVYVHRAVWEHHFGAIPRGLEVCHSCDVRNCVHPGHLFLGDRFANMGDAATKGRTSRGERRHSARLSETQVRSVLRRYTGAHGECAAMAVELGVSASSIENIVHRRKWKHVRA